MSKILELLNYSKKRGVNSKMEKEENLPGHMTPENFDSDTKEKLASTYIFNPLNTNERIIQNQNKSISRKHNAGQSQTRLTQLFPWFISFLAILLLLVNIAYRGRINVNIEILDGDSVQNQNAPVAAKLAPLSAIPAKKDLISTETEIQKPGIMPITTSLIVNGHLNSYVIKRLGFYGAAITKSKMLQDGLYLFNDGVTGWASIGIDFTKPMDFSNTTLDFFIKGREGGESLKLILRDTENNSYIPQAYNAIFNKNMKTDWQFVSIPFKNFNGTYNANEINHIGFEFGTQTTSNEPGSSIYVKKIKIVENSITP